MNSCTLVVTFYDSKCSVNCYYLLFHYISGLSFLTNIAPLSQKLLILIWLCLAYYQSGN